MADPEIDLRFIASQAVIDDVARVLAASGVASDTTRITDAAYLGLDFSVVADLTTIVGITLISDPIVPTLWRWLGGQERRTRIIVETPIGRVMLDSRTELTEEEIREKLRQLVGVL